MTVLAMTVLAMITAPRSLQRILAHLDLPTHPPPIATARLDEQLGLDVDATCYDVCHDTPSPSVAHTTARGPP